MDGSVATPGTESYVPSDMLVVLTGLKEKHGWEDVRGYNAWFRENKPDIPSSSVRRWTRSFCSGRSHSITKPWHVKYREDASIVPDRYSAIQNGEYRQHYDRWQREGEVRYVNLSCLHRPFNDPAIWNLERQIIHDFRPNIFPVFSDTLDADVFSQHKPKPYTSRIRVLNADIYPRNKYQELRWLMKTFVEDVKEVVPKDCTLLNLWGNHEDWTLRALLAVIESVNDPDLVADQIATIFDPMQEMGVLWVEADRRQWCPVIKDKFWIGHGTMARANEGATARGYMLKLKNAISVAVGHSHRQEVLWSTTPIGDRFYAICGTGGPRIRGYNKSDWTGHNWGFQTITHSTDSWRGAQVEDIRIHYLNGFYIARWRGKEYSERASVIYDDLWDMEVS